MLTFLSTDTDCFIEPFRDMPGYVISASSARMEAFPLLATPFKPSVISLSSANTNQMEIKAMLYTKKHQFLLNECYVLMKEMLHCSLSEDVTNIRETFTKM